LKPKGLSRKTVLAELKKIQNLDQHYVDGRILCSMCTTPHPIAKEAYQMFFESNLGDSGLFPGSMQIEKEVVHELAILLQDENAVGSMVSGGTEANLMALLAARNMTKVNQPEVVLPKSVHFSFTKICNLLRLKPVYVTLNNSFRVDTTEVEKNINKNTVAIVGNAGTAELGAVDNIEKLSEIALSHNVYLHVDAAFGGLIIPFLPNPKPTFDFSLEGVKSITVDPHKMGMAAIPAGGILFKNSEMLNFIKTETPYITDKVQYTFIGTRTGAAVASAWAVFKKLGMEGYQEIVESCMKNTKLLVNGIEKAGFKLVMEPTLNIFAFRSRNTKDLSESLRSKGWFVTYIPRYDCIRVVVMPHVKANHIDQLLRELVEIEKN
jgi:tyrosine decarboxylase / aspartate 1-decarboxylase